MQNMPPYPYYNPYGLPYPPMPPQQPPITSATPAATSAATVISTTNSTSFNEPEPHSSPSMNQDPVERMIIYIDWLANISPRQAPMFLEAKETLIEKGYS